jgi:hypothetical protein
MYVQPRFSKETRQDALGIYFQPVLDAVYSKTAFERDYKPIFTACKRDFNSNRVQTRLKIYFSRIQTRL